MTHPRFSLVIPCFNEEASLPQLLARSRYTASEGSGEVVLVDNGSSDGTAAFLTGELGPPGGAPTSGGVRWVGLATNAGYGGGILAGLRVAAAPVIGWTHADLQADPADTLRAVELFDGSRKTMVKGRRLGRPFVDVFFTTGMSIYESILLRTRLYDINAQPTLFNRELLEEWGNAPTDFALDLFALYSASRRRYTVRRIPVLFVPRRFGTSSWNTDWAAKRRFIRRTVSFSRALRRSM